jgi:hypothetical protein
MNTRYKLCWLLIVSSLVFAGCTNPLASHYLTTSAAHAAVDLRALREIRKGDTNAAIYTLEVDLNAERICCESFLADIQQVAALQTSCGCWKRFAFMRPIIRFSGIRMLAGKLLPNQSPEPTAVGACRSAVAVHVASRRWLSFFR